jgi:hypothetical protein
LVMAWVLVLGALRWGRRSAAPNTQDA